MNTTERKADVVGEYFDFLTERARLARNHDVKLAYEKAENRFRLVDAAMSELIEADKEYDEAHVGFDSRTASAEQIERIIAAWKRRRIALSRVQGGQ